MPKIILTSRYFKSPSRSNLGKLVRYMGTRESVEKLPVGIDNSPSTVRQKRIIADILKSFPEVNSYPEHIEYSDNPTKANATELIDAVIERNADRLESVPKLVKYMAERPGVEKLGAHGLFSMTDEKIDLDGVADEVGHHDGIVWTHVISLRREDAERLGYNNAAAWQSLLRRNVFEIAEAHKINPSDLKWYAAYHDKERHPHVHLMVYSKDPRKGYLTNKSIEHLRSTFANDIFRNEQYKLFRMETEQRERVRARVEEMLDEAPDRFSTTPEVRDLFLCLVDQLKDYSGRKVYGYLPRDIKGTVNRIVAAFEKDPEVSRLYAEWNRINREKLSLYYDRQKPDIPLAENSEFRKIKNDIIRAALQMDTYYNGQGYSDSQRAEMIFANVFASFLRIFSSSYRKKANHLSQQVDSKVMSAIEEKKRAHGLKTDYSLTLYNNPDEDDSEQQGMIM